MISQPPSNWLNLAQDAARKHRLQPELVCAVIEQESAWNPWAVRYEPAFYARYILPQITDRALGETEARARAFSWGLMQVMGQVAREHGFAGTSLAEICEPATGVEIGCRVLSAKMAAAKGDTPRGLLLWNGGGNPNYPEAVLARMRNYNGR